MPTVPVYFCEKNRLPWALLLAIAIAEICSSWLTRHTPVWAFLDGFTTEGAQSPLSLTPLVGPTSSAGICFSRDFWRAYFADFHYERGCCTDGGLL